uniref:G-protein coupled receptors family 3 profile domain-containing protein n=1 Tax=Myripristis murdjan TaxID=586833 RepID=A0A667ZGW0_9TELE
SLTYIIILSFCTYTYSKLLPGMTLGYRLYNGCGSENLVRAAVEAVSHLSTCACLSDKKLYPTFFRTVPSDRFQIIALLKLMEYFDWRWVGIIHSPSMYATQATTEFIKEAKKEGICVEYMKSFSRSSTTSDSITTAEIIRSSSSKVVLLFMSLSYTKAFLKIMEGRNITGKQWLGSESWITQTDLASATRKSILQGAMGFAIPEASIPGLAEFLLNLKPSDEPESAMIRAFWEDVFHCSFTPSNTSAMCNGTEDLRTISNDYTDMTEFRAVNNVYKAVYAVAHALHALLQCRNASNPTTGKQCVNMKDIQPKQVKGKNFKLNDITKIIWGGNHVEVRRALKDQCLPKPTEYLSYKEIMGALLTIFCCLGVFLSLLTSIIFLVHKETPIVKANNSELSFLLLFSLKLCFLCSLTFIGRPSDWSCMLRHTAFGITFVLCISCVLGKTIVVLMAFRATLPGSNVMKWFGPPQQRLSVLAFTLVQVVICILWLTINPPFPNRNMNYYKEKIILECALGSAIGFWAVLGYIGLLALMCFILAFLARKLPDSFNEAKFITFSMLIFCAVWITFIPAYVSSPGKFTVAVEIFAILASSFGLLICIFVPKCYIMIFKPEQNSKKHMMGKIPSRTL